MIKKSNEYRVETKLATTLYEVESNLNLLIDILNHSGYKVVSHNVVQSIGSPEYFIITVIGCKT